MIRARFRQLPLPRRRALATREPAHPPKDFYSVLPPDHRLPYDIEDMLARIFDRDDFVGFQPEFAPEMLCANARLHGHPVAIIANRRGFLKPRIGGIIYTETARKVAYFVELAERRHAHHLFAGRFRLHGGLRGRERRHHPRRRRDGGIDVVRQRAAHRAHD